MKPSQGEQRAEGAERDKASQGRQREERAERDEPSEDGQSWTTVGTRRRTFLRLPQLVPPCEPNKMGCFHKSERFRRRERFDEGELFHLQKQGESRGERVR